jgi:hypothetical protein
MVQFGQGLVQRFENRSGLAPSLKEALVRKNTSQQKDASVRKNFNIGRLSEKTLQ